MDWNKFIKESENYPNKLKRAIIIREDSSG